MCYVFVVMKVLTMMVKAAPRFATILCLSDVRIHTCRVQKGGHTAGWATGACQHGCYFRVEQMVHTLAMPIGEADSAIVNGVYVSTAEMAGWRGIGAERWREDGRGSF